MLERIRHLFRLDLRRRSDVSRDVDQEIAFHLDERTDALIARGWDPEAARAEAESSLRHRRLRSLHAFPFGRRP